MNGKLQIEVYKEFNFSVTEPISYLSLVSLCIEN